MYSDIPVTFIKEGVTAKTYVYIDYINKHFIKPTLNDKKVYSILVIGAGGFTLGYDDTKNDYTYIDIDGSLKDIAEDHLLKQKLRSSNFGNVQVLKALI